MFYDFIAYFIVICAIGYALYKGFRFFSNLKKGICCKGCNSCANNSLLKTLR